MRSMDPHPCRVFRASAARFPHSRPQAVGLSDHSKVSSAVASSLHQLHHPLIDAERTSSVPQLADAANPDSDIPNRVSHHGTLTHLR